MLIYFLKCVFFFPFMVTQIRFCLYVIPVSDLGHVAQQEKATS